MWLFTYIAARNTEGFYTRVKEGSPQKLLYIFGHPGIYIVTSRYQISPERVLPAVERLLDEKNAYLSFLILIQRFWVRGKWQTLSTQNFFFFLEAYPVEERGEGFKLIKGKTQFHISLTFRCQEWTSEHASYVTHERYYCWHWHHLEQQICRTSSKTVTGRRGTEW